MSFAFHCRAIMNCPRSSGKSLPTISMVMFCLSKLFPYNYNPSDPRQRVMNLTTMVLTLEAIFILSAAPYHVMQLVNLLVEQPSVAFYLRYHLSICPSYASSSINPFLYILLSGNFQKRLSQVQRRVTEKETNNMENILKQSFEESTWIIKV